MNPKFSIILPVRNGGGYVKDCVHSILSQTLNSFTLVILDNHSTDGTLQWLESLKDERIIIYPAAKPLSIEENWTRITSVPKNEFMTLIGHDDKLAPDYLEVMGSLVTSFPDASLYQTHFAFINSKGQKIRKCKPMKTESGPEFLQSILQKKIDIVGSGFMMRSTDYDSIGGIPDYPNLLFADFELWIRLSGIKYIAVSDSEAFYFRLHESTTSVSPDIKLQDAFERFIFFLEKLKNKNDEYNNVIKNYSNTFLLTNCRSLAHRLFRTPAKKRNNTTINSLLKKCRAYSVLLAGNGSLNPLSDPAIRIAKIIDSNSFTRMLFLLFKKLYKKPVLK